MGQGSEESEKFPAVLQYANARQQFDAPTEANLAWVWDLLCASGWVPQPADTPRHIWEELRTHQSRLVAWLEHIIAKRPNLIAGRVVVEQRVRHWAAQLVLCVRSETSSIPQTIPIHGLSHSMRPRTRDRIFANETPPPEHEIPQEVLSSQDGPPRLHPLMVLYRQLTPPFQENGKKWFHKCPSCKLFFLPLTTRAQACCSDACWGQWHPITPEANRGYQRTSRTYGNSAAEANPDAINTVYAGLTRQQAWKRRRATLEGVPADVLADYVYEKVWTQVKNSASERLARECVRN